MGIGGAPLRRPPNDQLPKRKPKGAERLGRALAKLRRFEKIAGRRAQKNAEPNDRAYDEVYAKKLRRMDPERIYWLWSEGWDEDAN